METEKHHGGIITTNIVVVSRELRIGESKVIIALQFGRYILVLNYRPTEITIVLELST